MAESPKGWRVGLLRRLWNWQRRRIDLRILWPACKAQAPNLITAKAAFALHAFHDVAWANLSEPEIIQIIEELS